MPQGCWSRDGRVRGEPAVHAYFEKDFTTKWLARLVGVFGACRLVQEIGCGGLVLAPPCWERWGGIVGAGLLPDLMGGLIPAEFALRTSGDSAIGR